MKHLILGGVSITGCDPTILSRWPGEDCLPAAKAFFSDRRHSPAEDREIKLILLGNGRVGKTSVLNRLIRDAFNADEKSTHGIRLEQWPIALSGGEARLKVWDFGGQDIYHGTHALFLRSRAVFVIVWDRDTEREPHYTEEVPHGRPSLSASEGQIGPFAGAQARTDWDPLTFENYPLAYWLDYVRAVSPQSPIIVVENKCDDGHGSAPSIDVCDLPHVRFSARESHGRSILHEHIVAACERELEDREARMLGGGRMAIKKKLGELRDNDGVQLLPRAEFQRMCDLQGERISSADELLKFLHNTGVVYHQSDLFDGQIILDQRWAVDAIYTIYHRQSCVRQLRERRGRFFPSTLRDLAWGDQFTDAEQRLFISFMESCSICFKLDDGAPPHPQPLSPGGARGEAESEYLAPEFLPPRSEVEEEIDIRLRAAGSTDVIHFRYRHHFLHPGLMRRFLVTVGRLHRKAALYWRDGVILDAKHDSAVALATCRRVEGNMSGGEIELQVRGQGRFTLLARLRNELERLHERGDQVQQFASIDGKDWKDLAVLDLANKQGLIDGDIRQRLAPFFSLLYRDPDARLEAPPASAADRTVYISYGRNDADKPDVDREGIVNRLCAALERHRFGVGRDRVRLKLGDSIRAFMEEIGRGACVVAVISDKYLKSEYAMFELCEIFRNGRALERLCVILMADAKINDLGPYLEHWAARDQQADADVRRHGVMAAGAIVDMARRCREIANHLSEYVGVIADRVQLTPETAEVDDFAAVRVAMSRALGVEN